VLGLDGGLGLRHLTCNFPFRERDGPRSAGPGGAVLTPGRPLPGNDIEILCQAFVNLFNIAHFKLAVAGEKTDHFTLRTGYQPTSGPFRREQC
jgi:hypothetical protein